MEQKKLVAKWMGWECRKSESGLKYFYLKGNPSLPWPKDWNPQDNDKATFKEWTEIYENMDEGQFRRFQRLMLQRLPSWQCPPDKETFFLTVSPGIRWEALIKMIKEKK